MKKTVELTAGSEQLLYVVQGAYGYGKGLTFKQALEAYKKYNGQKPTQLAVYLCLEQLTELEAFAEVTVDMDSLTYCTDKVILLYTSHM